MSSSHDDGMEGLAAGLKASLVSMAKTSAENLQSKNGFVGPHSVHHASQVLAPGSSSLVMNAVEVRSANSSPNPAAAAHQKVKQMSESPVSNVIEVVLRSSGGPVDGMMESQRNSGSGSILQVSRKRVSDPGPTVR